MALRDLLTERSRRPIFLAGAGGIGLSGLGRILKSLGVPVQGVDRGASPVTEALEQLGIPVALGHDARNLPPDARLVIRSAAIPDGAPEIQAARRHGIPLVKYAEAVGALMQGMTGIAVAGTHGKTTTTAMTAVCLLEADLDPTVLVGGRVAALGGTARVGRSDLLLLEACEYDRSFWNYRPRYAVITNLEADHLDYYRDLAEIEDAFRTFARKLPTGGVIIRRADDPAVEAVLLGISAAQHTFGVEVDGASVTARRLRLEGGRPSFDLEIEGLPAGRIQLQVPGRHNVLNALAALTCARAAGASVDACRAALTRFRGVDRRFQALYQSRHVSVIDDYAHHPTEVAATLRAARERFPDRRLLAVFQPHQYSRARRLLPEFAAALQAADEAWVAEIYRARDREEDVRAVSARDLVRAVRRGGAAARLAGDLSDLPARLQQATSDGPVTVLTLGAGSIYRVAHALAHRLREADRARLSARTDHPRRTRVPADARPHAQTSRVRGAA